MPTLTSPGVLVLRRGDAKEEWMKLKVTVNSPLGTGCPERVGIFTTTIIMAIITTITGINLTTNWV